MGIEQLFNDYGIAIAEEGDRHYRDGWVNVECPLCTGNPGFHLGFNTDGGYFHCHRCGGHDTEYVLRRLLNIDRLEAAQIIRSYRLSATRTTNLKDQPRVKISRHAFRLPSGVGPLSPPAIRYLLKRGFKPHQLVNDFGLQATGPLSRLINPETKKVIDFKFRILIPIWWEGQLVSYQTRDYTGRVGKDGLRYLSCPQAFERTHHKHIVYCQGGRLPQSAILVEGPTDVWRFGAVAAATLGIGYTPEQLRVVASRCKRVYTAFDPEPQAQQRAKRLCGDLEFRGVAAENLELATDPADMTQQEADALLKRLNLSDLK